MPKLSSDRGAAAVELAFVLPLLLLLVLGIVEFGRAYNLQNSITAAAREGVRELSITRSGASAITRADAAMAPVAEDGSYTVTVTTGCTGAAGSTGRVDITYPLQTLTGIFDETFDLTGTAVMRCGG